MFTNRKEAGILLADKLINYSNAKKTVIVAIPRGGVPVGYEIAKKLKVPLEIVLSKKIGHPFNKEYAIGAVTLKSSIINESVPGISNLYIEEETNKIRKILNQRYQLFYNNNMPIEFKNKTVIIVDDGVATGSTLISSIELIKMQEPLKIIVALPVGSSGALNKVKALDGVDSTICLSIPRNFQAVGQFYEEFNQVSDQEVIQLLKSARNSLNFKYLTH
jgi:putative phosphoribosyl transferase